MECFFREPFCNTLTVAFHLFWLLFVIIVFIQMHMAIMLDCHSVSFVCIVCSCTPMILENIGVLCIVPNSHIPFMISCLERCLVRFAYLCLQTQAW